MEQFLGKRPYFTEFWQGFQVDLNTWSKYHLKRWSPTMADILRMVLLINQETYKRKGESPFHNDQPFTISIIYIVWNSSDDFEVRQKSLRSATTQRKRIGSITLNDDAVKRAKDSNIEFKSYRSVLINTDWEDVELMMIGNSSGSFWYGWEDLIGI